jgi:hypothetical protein
MLSMGVDTKDDVLANILKRDQELRKTYNFDSAGTSLPEPTIQPPRQEPEVTTSLAVPVRLHSRSISAYQVKNIMSGQLKGAGAGDKTHPTYEEFVSQLAISLSININNKNGEKPLMRDTVLEHNRRSATDTIIENYPAGNIDGDERDTIMFDSLSPNLKESLVSSSNEPALKTSKDGQPLDALATPLKRPIKKIQVRDGVGISVNTPIIQPDESLKPVMKTEYLAKPNSANSYSSPSVFIPSRKESRNWIGSASSEPGLTLNLHFNDTRSLSRRAPIISPPMKSGRTSDTIKNAKMQISEAKEIFLKSQQRHSPPPIPQSEESHRILKNSNTSLSPRQYVTLKLIQSGGAPTSIKVPLVIDLKSLVDKVSMVAGSMDDMRICYRDVNFEMITITDEESWLSCKKTIVEEKLTLIIMVRRD